MWAQMPCLRSRRVSSKSGRNMKKSHGRNASPILLSVVIPSRNYGHFLDECLESIFRVDRDDIEVILVDDGSTDGSKEIALATAGRFTNSNLHYHNSGGVDVSAARNLALNNADGEYCCLMDADDFWETKAFSRFIDFAIGADLDIAYADWFDFENRDRSRNRVRVVPKWGGDPLASFLATVHPCHSVIFKRNACRFDERYSVSEVDKFWFDILLEASSLGYFNEAVSNYRNHDTLWRITRERDHWEPSHRIELFSAYKTLFQLDDRFSDLCRACFDQQIAYYLVECARRKIAIDLKTVNFDVKCLRDYFWWKPLGMAGFLYFFGPKLGPPTLVLAEKFRRALSFS